MLIIPSVHEPRFWCSCSTALVALPVLAAVACGPKDEPVAVPPDPEPRAVAEEPSQAEVEAEQPEAEPAPPPSPDPEPEPVALEPLCQAKCDRLADECTKAAVETCRAGCEQWTRTHERCMSTAATALTCARDASDLVCAPVVPESCGQRFLRVAACRNDPESFEPEPIETKRVGLPAGWERVNDAQAGFSVPMPSGAKLDTASGRTWRATGPDGSPYSARVLPPLPKKPDAKTWIKLASDTLEPCNLETRLHGLIDKPDFLAMRYDSQCKGSGERHGTLYVLPKAFVVTAIEGPEGDHAELFLYGLEPLGQSE